MSGQLSTGSNNFAAEPYPKPQSESSESDVDDDVFGNFDGENVGFDNKDIINTEKYKYYNKNED